MKLNELLQKCVRRRASMDGKAIHSQIITTSSSSSTLTSNILINVYSKCGHVKYARHVFDSIPQRLRTVVSWNTMICTYTQNGYFEDSLLLFKSMMMDYAQETTPFTLSSVLSACASKFAVSECSQLHAFALKRCLNSNVFVSTALIDVYAKCCAADDAIRVFQCMPVKSEVTWSSMINGYIHNHMYEEALLLFRTSQKTMFGLNNRNQFTISSILSACAGLAALIEGKQLHSLVTKTGFDSNVYVASALVDVYSKCGCIKHAYTVFSNVDVNIGVERKDNILVLWNAMISGFSKHACSIEAMVLFEKMQQMGMFPNELTYISVLSVCGHKGLVKEGRTYFDLMRKEHNIEPNIFHFSCMVDILGRAGLVIEAMDTVKNMPLSFTATPSMWGSLLSSCRIHGNVELGEVAAKNLFEIEPDNAGNHVLISNIHASNKKWDEVVKSRKLLKENSSSSETMKKEKGQSWIEIKDKVHTFMVGETNHPKTEAIYVELEELMEEMKRVGGYRAETEHEHHNVEEKHKQELLKHHSEKLALVFGLMCIPNKGPSIRIMKNLRICGDCHTFMKIASSLKGREIIVRDTNRFHHFNQGSCSCNDFW